LTIADYLKGGKWIPDTFVESSDYCLWTFFPFGIPAQLGIMLIDAIYLIIKGKDEFWGGLCDAVKVGGSKG